VEDTSHQIDRQYETHSFWVRFYSPIAIIASHYISVLPRTLMDPACHNPSFSLIKASVWHPTAFYVYDRGIVEFNQ